MLAKLRGLFTPEAIAKRLRTLPVIKTTVMDTIFPARLQHELPVIGVEDLVAVAKAMPLVRRGGVSIAMGEDTLGIGFIEPLPVLIHADITGADLNNLRMLDPLGLENWATRRTDFLRKSCRATTEAIAATSLTGKISWPVKLDGGGFTKWEYDFGAPLAHDQTVKFDNANAKASTVHTCLTEMQEAIEDNGYGSEPAILAGRDAFAAIYALVEKSQSTAKLKLEMRGQEILVGDYVVRRCSEKYWNPETGVLVEKIPPKKLVMVGMDAQPTLFYAALDDINARFAALPFYVRPENIMGTGQTGIRLFGSSKPLPAPVVKATCWAEVL